MLFDTFDRSGNAEFPFPKQVVFRALCDAVSGLKSMQIETRDELASRLDIKTQLSAFSWGERISVSVSSNGEQASIISVQSAAKTAFGSVWTHKKNRSNVRDIINSTSNILQSHGATWRDEMAVMPGTMSMGAPPVSVAEELAKLAQLRDKGILDESEFQAQKDRLLRS